MSYRLPPLASMRAFEAAARHLSFKKAAAELHVTPAAVSLQIKALESFLGVSLFRRLTRALEITPEGLAMLPKIRAGFECFAEAIEGLGISRVQTLNVDAPPSLAVRWLLPRLPEFSAVYPDLALRLRAILMSMPPVVNWRYQWAPEPGTPEARLYTDFLRPRDWAHENLA